MALRFDPLPLPLLPPLPLPPPFVDEHESNESAHPVFVPFDKSNEMVHVSSIVADIKLEQFVNWKVMPGIMGAFGDWLELLRHFV